MHSELARLILTLMSRHAKARANAMAKAGFEPGVPEGGRPVFFWLAPVSMVAAEWTLAPIYTWLTVRPPCPPPRHARASHRASPCSLPPAKGVWWVGLVHRGSHRNAATLSLSSPM